MVKKAAGPKPESVDKPVSTKKLKTSKNGVQKSSSKRKGDTKDLVPSLLKAQFRAQTQETGPWSKLFRKAPGMQEEQHKIWKHVFRSTEVRHEEARERNVKLVLTDEEKKAGLSIPEPETWAPKRPSNNFILYRMTFQEFAKKHYGSAHHNTISEVAAFSWALEPNEVKATFAALAVFDHWCMLEACPRYRFIPNKADTAKANATQQSKKESGEETKQNISQPATLTRRNPCRPGAHTSPYQPLYRTPFGYLNGSRQPAAANNINYTYLKAPNYPIGKRIQQHPVIDNFYYQSGTLSSNFPASGMNFNHYQLPLDNLMNDFVMMDIKSDPGANKFNGANSLNQLSLGHLGGTYASIPESFPMIAQQHDGLTVGGGSTQFEDYTAADEFRFDDYVYMS